MVKAGLPTGDLGSFVDNDSFAMVSPTTASRLLRKGIQGGSSRRPITVKMPFVGESRTHRRRRKEIESPLCTVSSPFVIIRNAAVDNQKLKNPKIQVPWKSFAK
jgi:hypothetical protein